MQTDGRLKIHFRAGPTICLRDVGRRKGEGATSPEERDYSVAEVQDAGGPSRALKPCSVLRANGEVPTSTVPGA